MGLTELVVATLATLCLNSTCVDDYYQYKTNSFNKLKALKDEIKHETFVVTTLKNGPLSGYEIRNGTIVGTGVAFEIFNIMQNEYGFKYTIKVPENNVFIDSRTGNHNGVSNMLVNNIADVAVAFLPEHSVNQNITYSRNLDRAQWVVLMKRPKESATGSGLLAPFTEAVWGLIIVSLLGVGPILWLAILLKAKLCKEDHDVVFTLPACMWFVYGALLKQGSTLNPRTDSSRILFSTWWIFITILTSFYTANLTAFLTLSKFTLSIEKPDDIGKKHFKWITNKGNGITEQLYINDGGSSLRRSIGDPQNEVDVDEQEILADFVTKYELMYIREKTVLETVMYENYKLKAQANVDESDRCTYVITTFAVCTLARSFAFKKDFKYKDLFDFTIQHLSESGITEFKQREFLPDTTICPQDLGKKEQRLRISDLAMTYKIVGGGLIISTIIFAVELVISYWKQPAKIEKWSINQSKLENNKLFTTRNFFNQSELKLGFDEKRDLKQFASPPPSYHMLFGQPPGTDYKKQTINGRDYWVTSNNQGITSLVPQRGPSALLFQFTN